MGDDIVNYIAIGLGMLILYFAIQTNRSINADRNSKPVEPIKPIEPTEEPQTSFTKEELAEAVQKGIEERDKKNKLEKEKNTQIGCLVVVVLIIVYWYVMDTYFVDDIIDWIESFAD